MPKFPEILARCLFDKVRYNRICSILTHSHLVSPFGLRPKQIRHACCGLPFGSQTTTLAYSHLVIFWLRPRQVRQACCRLPFGSRTTLLSFTQQSKNRGEHMPKFPEISASFLFDKVRLVLLLVFSVYDRNRYAMRVAGYHSGHKQPQWLTAILSFSGYGQDRYARHVAGYQSGHEQPCCPSQPPSWLLPGYYQVMYAMHGAGYHSDCEQPLTDLVIKLTLCLRFICYIVRGPLYIVWFKGET